MIASMPKTFKLNEICGMSHILVLFIIFQHDAHGQQMQEVGTYL